MEKICEKSKIFITDDDFQDVDQINKKINEEIDYKILEQLSDNNLMEKYKQTKSVKSKIKTLRNVLEKHQVDPQKIDLILSDYIPDIVPSGTKGVIRGNLLNKIVKEKIESMNLDKDRFEIAFEKKIDTYPTSDIPDWYIMEKETKKTIVGMNQMDLWFGGQQTNRAGKYILEQKKGINKIVCVVCNKVIVKKNTKVYDIFYKGFKEQTLCYLNGLKNIIDSFYNKEY